MKEKYKKALMDMAARFGECSCAERLKVGALIVKNDSIVAMGVNGQPPGWPSEACEDSSGFTLPTVRHAEVAALEKLWGSPETSSGAALFVNHSPCLSCAIKIKTAKIKEVYYRHKYRNSEGVEYLESAGISVEQVK